MAIDFMPRRVDDAALIEQDLDLHFQFVVTQVGSGYHQAAAVLASLRSIGLGKKRREKTVRLPFTPQRGGYVRKAHHLLDVEVEIVAVEVGRFTVPIDPQQAIKATRELTRERVLVAIADLVAQVAPARSGERGPLVCELSYKNVVRVGTATSTTAVLAPAQAEQGPTVTAYSIPVTGVAIDYAPGGWLNIQDDGDDTSIIIWECTTTPDHLVSAIGHDMISEIVIEDSRGGARTIRSTEFEADPVVRLIRIELDIPQADASVIWERLLDGDTHVSVIAARQPTGVLRRLFSSAANVPVDQALGEIRARTETVDA